MHVWLLRDLQHPYNHMRACWSFSCYSFKTITSTKPSPMRARAGYEKLPTDESLHKWDDFSSEKPNLSAYKLEEEGEPQVPIPWPSIALAIFLMMFGMTSFVFAWLHFTQEVFGKTQAEVGFTLLGLMTFIPGYYHVRIAYYTWKGARGYSWDQIPAWG